MRHDTTPDLYEIWLGVSVVGERDFWKLDALRSYTPWMCRRWASFEPLIACDTGGMKLEFEIRSAEIRFVVIGGLSDGQGRVIPPSEPYGLRAEWVQPILDAAAEAGCRIFCKNLRREVWSRLVNPRSHKLMESAVELREVPDEWVKEERIGA
jgi:protein gp37